MKILVITVDYFPNIGGISTMVHHLCNAITDKGNDVILLAPENSTLLAGYEARYKLIVDKDSKVKVRDGAVARVEDKRILRLLKNLLQVEGYERVLLMHPFYYGYSALKFSLKNNIKLTSVFYGYELRALLLTKNSILNNLRLALNIPITNKEKTFKIIEKSNNILAISNYTANLVKKVNRKSKVIISGCGISEQDFDREVRISPSYNQLVRLNRRKELGMINADNKLLIFVGRLVESKNISLVIKALKYLPDVSFSVVGSGPDINNLKSLAMLEKVDGKINWIGEISEEDKWSCLRAADAFVLPSKELPTGQVEGFGIVLLEATAAGVPIMAANSGGMVDIIEDNKNGFLFNPNDELQLANKIKILLSDSERSGYFVNKSRQKIIEKFNWNSVASLLIKSWS